MWLLEFAAWAGVVGRRRRRRLDVVIGGAGFMPSLHLLRRRRARVANVSNHYLVL